MTLTLSSLQLCIGVDSEDAYFSQKNIPFGFISHHRIAAREGSLYKNFACDTTPFDGHGPAINCFYTEVGGAMLGK